MDLWARAGGGRKLEGRTPVRPAGGRFGSVAGRCQHALGGYRKAGDVRLPEGVEVEGAAALRRVDRTGVAERDPGDFAGTQAFFAARADQAALDLAAVGADQ